MMSLITVSKAQKQLVDRVRMRRLTLNLTQEGLAKRAGIPLPTYRAFEQKGILSLESFLKVLSGLGSLEDIKFVLLQQTHFTSIDDVLETPKVPQRKRGRHK